MMGDPSKELQIAVSEILKDLMSMSADVISKSKRHLDEVESLSVDLVSTDVGILLEKINKNVDVFMKTLKTANDIYQKYIQNETSQVKKKMNLSLKKKDETDVDLTSSDEESTNVEESLADTSLEVVIEENGKIDMNNVEENGKEDGSSSDADSEKTVFYFDAPMINGSTEKTVDAADELVKALFELEENDKELLTMKKKIESAADTASFDFDDDLTAEMQKIVSGYNQELSDDMDKMMKPDEGQDLEETRKDNHELLDLLTKAIGENAEPVLMDIEEEADEALKILEDEASLSSFLDSDESRSSFELSVDEDQPGGDQSDGNVSDTESTTEEAVQYELKTLSISIKKKVDEISDAEIDRLCNENNLNKRKCIKELKRHKKKRRKRIRLLSSSSSSSESSQSSSENSITPDLVDFHSERPLTPPNIQLPDVSVLADELLDRLEKEDDDEDEDMDVSSLSSLDSEKEDKEEENKKDKVEEIKNEDAVQEIPSDDGIIGEETEPKKQKKIGSWRNEIFFGTSSESEDDVIVLNDPLEGRIDDDDDSKEKVKLKFLNDGETMVITDSDGSDSDDVTFVDEITDESAGRGRRNIRAILSDNELNELTQKAKSEEDARILRLEEHSRTLESIQSQHEDFVLDVDVKTGAASVTVNYNLVKMLKPHQKEGVQFMWEACYESIDVLKTKPGTGCILAHCMGLGKTLQVITLIHTLFTHRATQTRHVLITCPLSTVTNWRNEFKKTFRQLNNDQTPFKQFFIVKGDVKQKITTIRNWRLLGGVLVMGYETFQILTNEKLANRVTPQERNYAMDALIDPGPDLIVCDEGHMLKNGKTLKTKALMKVRTKRRIVLTGTPLQNNLKEYYFMVEFVKPHLLGTYTEYTNRFATPILNGQYHDSRPEDIKLMKKRTHVLTKVLKKTIHRAEAAILSSYLPEIVDYTIFVKLAPLQIELYTKYIAMVTSESKDLGKGFLSDVTMLNFNNLHPYTVELSYTKPKNKRKRRKKTNEEAIEDDEEEEADHLSKDWYKSILPADVAINASYSYKLKIILDILDETTRLGEKVLIFGQYLVQLDVVEKFLKECGTANCRLWRSGLDYYRMDSRTPVDHRDQLCKRFNTDPTSKVFLLTHRVGGLGLNLTGANRVIMIGCNHNPSLDTQSMYRVYRFGQTKKCYVYRLLSLATMEEKIYHKCVVKLHLSGTVVDKLHFVKKMTSTDLQEMYKVDFSNYLEERPIPIVPTDKLLATILQNSVEIYRYYPHNTLLENRPEDELTDEDKKIAWEEFNNMEEAAKQPQVVVHPPAYPIYPAAMYARYRHDELALNTRGNTSTLVPNPANNNTRGFIPRFVPNGMHLPNPPSGGAHTANPFLKLLQNIPSTSGHNRQATPLRRSTLTSSASEALQQIRQNIQQALRTSDAPPVGEFNYALNKIL